MMTVWQSLPVSQSEFLKIESFILHSKQFDLNILIRLQVSRCKRVDNQ
jgi:hypothetical protein